MTSARFIHWLSRVAIQADPTHESKVIGAPRCDYVVDGIVEDGNRTFDLHESRSE